MGEIDSTERLGPDLERIKRDILSLSKEVSPGEAGYTRLSFSEEDRKARDYVARLMREEAGLSVRIDPAGNLIGRKEGAKSGPAILMGSHIDTVRGGGRFDGMSGVIAAVEIARRMKEKGVETVHPVEVVVFLAEEPSPFGLSTIGSRAMAGSLSPDLLHSLKDQTGRTLAKAIAEMGGDPANLQEARRSSEDVLAYLELHIEQGPVLAAKGVPIGLVTGIVGISKGKVEVIGRSDHAGTTSMDLRRDALAAGSEIILALERICAARPGVVGTVGRVEVYPNASNVVPGRVVLDVEVRSLQEDRIEQAIVMFEEELERIKEKRGVHIEFELGAGSHPVVFDPAMVERITAACEGLGIRYVELSSGAGHDTNHMAEITQVGMIFIPSREGRSHCPEEWTAFEHVCLGAEVLGQTLLGIDSEVAVEN